MSKKTRSEAGKIGYEKSLPKRLQQQEERIKKYYENPKQCKYCGNLLPYNKRLNTFCNSSCSASFNNKTRAKKLKVQKKLKTQKKCLNCGKILNGKNKKYCSNNCQKEYEYIQNIKKWKKGEISGIKGDYGIANFVRKYMLEKANYKCEKCGWNEKNKYSNKIPLEIHHKDGNYLNNSEENLEVLCPNCHSLTSTYKNLNKEGRKIRAIKYS